MQKSIFGNNLKNTLKYYDVEIPNFAKEMKITELEVKDYISGKKIPEEYFLINLSKSFSLRQDWFLEDHGIKNVKDIGPELDKEEMLRLGHKLRSCLRCDATFMSEGAGNRICNSCKGNYEFANR